MRATRWLGLVLLGLVGGLTLRQPPGATGCAPALPPGFRVRIASESALILWDAATRTEHFIRRGTFETASPDFGFLVPTPSEPELHEADDNLFSTLEDWTKPREVHMPTHRGRGAFRTMAPAAAPAPPPPVTVLGAEVVAGLDAVKLKATDTQALLDWLKKHGYASRPELEAWLDRYVKDGWVITAFKIAKSPGSTAAAVSTQALRLTFQTDKPLYPYREPEDMRAPGAHPPRFLRVFVLSSEKMEAGLGEKLAARPANLVWAAPIAAHQAEELNTRLKITDPRIPATPWLTVFEDGNSPRLGEEELYFQGTPDTTVVERPPIVHHALPGGRTGSAPPGLPPPGELTSMALIAGAAAAVVLLLLLLWFLSRQVSDGSR